MKNPHLKFKRVTYFTYFTYLALLLVVLPARAATIEKMEISPEKIIQVSGFCADVGIAVHIFLASSTEPFYTAGGVCHDGQYYFKDDLAYWGFADGDYGIKIYDANSPLINPSNEEYFRIETVASEIQPDPDEQIIDQDDPADDSDSDEPNLTPEDKENNSQDAPGFLARIIGIIENWFKGAVMFIKELVAEKITASKLCLGETCMMEDQLKELFEKKQIFSASDEMSFENLSEEADFIVSSTVDNATATTATSLLMIEDTEFIENW